MSALNSIWRTMTEPYVALYRWVKPLLDEGALATGKAWTFLADAPPSLILKNAKALQASGDRMRHGRKAPLTIAPGIVLSRAGGAALAVAPLVRTGGLLAGAAGAAAAAFALASPFALATLPLFVAIFVAASGPAIGLARAGLLSAAMAGGAAAGLLPALCSIPGGFTRRREAIAQEEFDRRNADALSPSELSRLSALDREAHLLRHETTGAAPHERIEWLEDLKAKFPEEFAAAATPSPEELAPVAGRDVVLQKPLQLKNPAAPAPARRKWSLRR